MSNAAFARLAALWFGLQFVWGAVLAVSLQARSIALAGGDGLRAYALVAAAGAVAGTLAQLVVGPLSDRRRERGGSRRPFYLAGVAIAIPAVIWLYLAPSFAQLLGAFFALQIGMNVVTGPYQAVVPDFVPLARAGRASAWLGVLQPLGNAGGLVTAGFIADGRIVAATIAAVLATTWAITAHATATLAPQPLERAPLRFDRDFRTLVASRAAINFGFYTLLGFLFFYVEQSLGVRGAAVRTQTALLFLTFTLANVAGAALAARPADRADKRIVVLIANAIVAAGLVALALAPSPPLAFVAVGVAGVAWGGYFIADWALACTLLPRGAMAAAMGVWNVAATTPQIVAPLITAPLVEAVDAIVPGAGPRVAIALATLEFTLGAFWLLRLPRPVARPAAP